MSSVWGCNLETNLSEIIIIIKPQYIIQSENDRTIQGTNHKHSRKFKLDSYIYLPVYPALIFFTEHWMSHPWLRKKSWGINSFLLSFRISLWACVVQNCIAGDPVLFFSQLLFHGCIYLKPWVIPRMILGFYSKQREGEDSHLSWGKRCSQRASASQWLSWSEFREWTLPTLLQGLSQLRAALKVVN